MFRKERMRFEAKIQGLQEIEKKLREKDIEWCKVITDSLHVMAHFSDKTLMDLQPEDLPHLCKLAVEVSMNRFAALNRKDEEIKKLQTQGDVSMALVEIFSEVMEIMEKEMGEQADDAQIFNRDIMANPENLRFDDLVPGETKVEDFTAEVETFEATKPTCHCPPDYICPQCSKAKLGFVIPDGTQH